MSFKKKKKYRYVAAPETGNKYSFAVTCKNKTISYMQIVKDVMLITLNREIKLLPQDSAQFDQSLRCLII